MRLSAPALVIPLFLAVANCTQAQAPGLMVSETGQGTIEHVVTIEMPKHFRLGFVAGMNYGLSQWFDLANDPAASRNITHRLNDDEGDQGSLFNQVLNPGDLIGHILMAKFQFKDAPRACRILEANSVRVRVETEYHPMLNRDINTKLRFRTTYTIYGSGRIGINHQLIAEENQTIELWRNSVISLGDPSYTFSGLAKGTGVMPDETNLTDAAQNWKPGQWAGFQVNLPDWITYEILDNTATVLKLGRKLSGAKAGTGGLYEINSQTGKFGWLRCTDLQSPYQWQNSTSAFLRMYWDPTTPEPYRNWTKAGIMLAPRPDNPQQGGQGVHGWNRFKRFYYECGKFELTAKVPVVQEYMLQIGTAGDAWLPDLAQAETARAMAEDYRTPATLTCTQGRAGNPAFDFGRACHRLVADNGRVAFSPGKACLKPVFEIAGIDGAAVATVRINGKPVDVLSGHSDEHTLVIQLPMDLPAAANVEIAAPTGAPKPP